MGAGGEKPYQPQPNSEYLRYVDTSGGSRRAIMSGGERERTRSHR